MRKSVKETKFGQLEQGKAKPEEEEEEDSAAAAAAAATPGSTKFSPAALTSIWEQSFRPTFTEMDRVRVCFCGARDEMGEGASASCWSQRE